MPAPSLNGSIVPISIAILVLLVSSPICHSLIRSFSFSDLEPNTFPSFLRPLSDFGLLRFSSPV